MALRIEDYALIGDTQSAALVGRNGSIDWLCLPRFDSAACMAALLGSPDNGRWQIAPASNPRPLRRRYRGDTLIVETELAGDDGVIRVIDFMPIRGNWPDVVRIVEGVEGSVRVRMELAIRFDYGSVVPWVRQIDDALVAIAGPDALMLRCPVETHGEGMTTVAEFTVEPGKQIPFVLTWFPSHQPVPPAIHPLRDLRATEDFWNDWVSKSSYDGPWRDAVVRSLITLKALTYAPTGGIVASATTSLPEAVGGERNWDYRFCWLRDATLTLYAFMLGGYRQEAERWREWLLRAVAGDPERIQIMYGVGGERRLEEFELPHLGGYEGSKPVRIGNAASKQLQLDVYGELLDALFQARRIGIPPDPWVSGLEEKLLGFLEGQWNRPDQGIWEIRGEPRHFTHSKIMAWVAFDRAIRTAGTGKLEGPLGRWRKVRDTIHAEVCARAFDPKRNTFTQSYGAPELDAALLLMPMVGFLPATDPRVQGTVAAVERELNWGGFVRRYDTREHGNADGLPGVEGVFLACTFWLADNHALAGRMEQAEAVFERLLSVRNDVGLLAEQYQVDDRRLLGNFPQAFSHLALVNTAFNLSKDTACAIDHRPTRTGSPP